MKSLKENMPYWFGAVVVLFIMCFVLLYFSEAQIPTTFTSSGIVAIISAVIGVVLTAFAISIQLKQQSNAEAQKDKDVKIFEQKMRVYSEFTSKLWEIVYAYDVEDNTDRLREKHDELKLTCFDKLVFFLKEEETKQLTIIIEQIDTTKPMDYNLLYICKITNILQSSLENKYETESSLKYLYNAFDTKNIESKEKENTKHLNAPIKGNNTDSVDITFWHFNMLDEKQLKAFKDGNWLLALIEYDENWRTNLIRQVKPNDIIFLFKRGGLGYIGAFKALYPQFKILEEGEIYSDIEKAKYDIYDGIDDGASLASNILVEPIAYNYCGVGYKTVRRRTIERMNDTEAVKFLLNRFNGKDLDDNQLAGKGKLDSETPIELNDNYFSEIVNKNL